MSIADLSFFFKSRRNVGYALLSIVCLYLIFLFSSGLTTPLRTPHTSQTRPYPPSLPKVDSSRPNAGGSPVTSPAQANRPTTEEAEANEQAPCRSLPGADDIAITLKTGAGGVYASVPEHLLTLFKCTPNYAIFSDVEQFIGDQQIFDAFKSLPPSWIPRYPELEYYSTLQQYHAEGQDVAKLQSEEKETGDDRKGWKFDKWKWFAFVVATFEKFPDKKWYLFIEGDTAVNWPNLLLWLAELNPEDKIYAGSQNSQAGISFAHGGSGVLVSRASMRLWMKAYKTEGQLDIWEKDLADSCCGDVMFAKQLKDAGVEMTLGFPLLQGEAPLTIDWNPRHMCAAAITWHHVQPSDIDMLWGMQMKWVEKHSWSTPMLFRDIFVEYVERLVRDKRVEWDNISADTVHRQPSNAQDEEWLSLPEVARASIQSFEHCREACAADKNCMQFKYKDHVCSLGDIIRIGHLKQGDSISSGWIVDRVHEYGKGFQSCRPNWKFNQ